MGRIINKIMSIYVGKRYIYFWLDKEIDSDLLRKDNPEDKKLSEECELDHFNSVMRRQKLPLFEGNYYVIYDEVLVGIINREVLNR